MHHFITTLFTIIITFSNIIQNWSESSLVPLVCVIKVFIEYKFSLITTINWIVCKVHEHVRHVLFCGLAICIGRETSQSFLKQINTQWIYRKKHDIEATIKFKIINKHGFFYILLAYIMIVWVEVFVIIGQKYTLSLASSLWLYYVNRSII